ncbi:MAG: lamin tail domain-containing protein [Flavobacteriia bacterium]|nr:lamin tail domain-containing protein [Flavobacteriia bacterium]
MRKKFTIVFIGCYSLLLTSCKTDPVDIIYEPRKVYIEIVVATPTADEYVTLKNNSGSERDLSGWTLGDKDDPDAFKMPNGMMLMNGARRSFPGSSLGFQINDSGEKIYLKDSTGIIVDTWSN